VATEPKLWYDICRKNWRRWDYYGERSPKVVGKAKSDIPWRTMCLKRNAIEARAAELIADIRKVMISIRETVL
jgi:hypothetical protein